MSQASVLAGMWSSLGRMLPSPEHPCVRQMVSGNSERATRGSGDRMLCLRPHRFPGSRKEAAGCRLLKLEQMASACLRRWELGPGLATSLEGECGKLRLSRASQNSFPFRALGLQGSVWGVLV